MHWVIPQPEGDQRGKHQQLRQQDQPVVSQAAPAQVQRGQLRRLSEESEHARDALRTQRVAAEVQLL